MAVVEPPVKSASAEGKRILSGPDSAAWGDTFSDSAVVDLRQSIQVQPGNKQRMDRMRKLLDFILGNLRAIMAAALIGARG
jgi:hypothetical protein